MLCLFIQYKAKRATFQGRPRNAILPVVRFVLGGPTLHDIPLVVSWKYYPGMTGTKLWLVGEGNILEQFFVKGLDTKEGLH